MRGIRLFAVVSGVVAMSGCAGGRAHQNLARLQSQVGLLEERVSQLERASVQDVTAMPLTSRSVEPEAAAAPLTAPERLTPRPERASVKLSARPSMREIQEALKSSGFYQGAIDGKMGPVTREAIKEFQRVHGLSDDGVVGKQTWAKLNAYADLSGGTGELNVAGSVK